MIALIAEDFGGITRAAGRHLRLLADTVKHPKHRDGTTYGDHSTRSFHAHHSAAISAAILMGVAAQIEKGIKARESQRCRVSGGAP